MGMRTWMPAVLLAAVSLGAVSLGLTGCGGSGHVNPRPAADNTNLVKLYRGAASGEDSGGGEAAKAIGWGTVKGQFVYGGIPPSLPPLNPGDIAACRAHPLPDEALLVDAATKGIRNVAVYTKTRLSPGLIHEDFKTDEYKQKEVLFDQNRCLFQQHVLAIDLAQTMLIKNSDSISHNTDLKPPGDVPSNTLLAAGLSTNYKFSRAQNAPVAVSCSIHGWMKAYILPQKDPYFAVTDAQGRFTIEKVPAGVPLQFFAWHESAGGNKILQTINVQLTADGEEKDLGQITLQPSQFTVK